jgi:hypothetical protein
MICCDNLIHPFQHDPGVSQRQRVIEDLLSGSASIDGRTMAALLNYFTQLSRQINYYDAKLNVSDWQPFFQKSIPFSLAAIIQYNKSASQKKIDNYNRLFNKKPNRHSLQLIIHFIYNHTIRPVNQWHQQIKGSELPAERVIEKLIKDKLSGPVKKFLCLTNFAVQKYKISKLDISKLMENDAWNLPLDEIKNTNCFAPAASGKRKRLIALRNEIINLFPGLLSSISLAGTAAELSMEQSLFPLKEELQKKHTPHLALLFAFLKLFSHLQGDLNSYTKKHLDFFYQDVLKLKPRPATADKAHIIFEIQKQLDKYLLKKDLRVKDGKDNKKAEIYFSLDDEIVVNKTEVADVRTLFLNNQLVHATSFTEGVYMAPDARKADGVKIDFKDDGPLNWPTLGSKYSKYTDPEQKFIKPYPNARIGFILASPVLLLNEGTRTVTITLDCELHNDYCNELRKNKEESVQKNCCQPIGPNIVADDTCNNDLTEQLSACEIYDEVSQQLNKKYYYISKPLIQEAIKKGISNDIILKLRKFLLDPYPPANPPHKLCYCPVEKYNYDAAINEDVFKDESKDGFTNEQVVMLSEIFKPERVFKISFSGEKEWIEPSEVISMGITESPKITMVPAAIACQNDPVDPSATPVTYPVTITIKAILNPDKPAVTFFNKEKLKEELNTTLPVVKVELNDHIKLNYTGNAIIHGCCLNTPVNLNDQYISLYHFFRNVKLRNTNNTKIDVQVCGLKNFIVQNDESVMDVNGPVYPFGARPKIIDFDVVNPADPPLANPNLIGPNFYIGSKEIFCKKWNTARINLNWKDKPSDFREYYKAYVVEDVALQIFGLNQDNFKIRISSLQNGNWSEEATNRKLFDASPPTPIPGVPAPCAPDGTYNQGILLQSIDFPAQVNLPLLTSDESNEPFKADTKYGFIKINLRDQDFLHKDYAYVLSRQMMALGKYPDQLLEDAVYQKDGSTVIVFKNFGNLIRDLENNITDVETQTDQARFAANNMYTTFANNAGYNPLPAPIPPAPLPGALPLTSAITNAERDNLFTRAYNVLSQTIDAEDSADALVSTYEALRVLYLILDPFGTKTLVPLQIPIPNEPWTPIIKNISLDYTATATLTDIDLIHLYPYKDTYKAEQIELQPALFPTFCDEGTMYIGLKGLVPGTNLNILFQLAEATADSELEREEVVWYYLDNNQWKTLRKGFEVTDDATEELTTSGIIKFALPENMTNDNTILPKDLHWIKASIPRNSQSVSETIGIHTQAIQVVFTNEKDNDKLRLGTPLPAGSVAKLKEADANIKKVEQPYDSFGGKEPEVEKQYYVRASELLRHKGRAIQKWDYERITLEAFPQIYRVKCINHSFALNAHRYINDFPVAPGYVLLAVIPDLTKLKAGNSFEPKAPVSLLEDINEYIRKRTSPFVRLRVMNPRYEKVEFCLKVKLYKGKDENYYKEKLKEDLREFLAPWAIGEYSKLSFGQCVNRSDLVRFMEGLDYIDYIIDLKMKHAMDSRGIEVVGNQNEVCPNTPRSILVAGEIDVCIGQDDCEKWDERRICLNQPEKIIDYCKQPVVIN